MIRLTRKFGTFLTALLILGGCAEIRFLTEASKVGSRQTIPPLDPAQPDLGKRYKVGKPYEIKGIWYYPKVDYGLVEEGIASWYGPNFHGKPTANGAIFDEMKVSAAHRTLPLPSVVRVTNLENGRSIKVIVNDRGPFAHSRIIDLSRRAAQLLGFERQGTTLVRVEMLELESRKIASRLKGGPDFTGESHANLSPKPKSAPTIEVSGEALAPPPGVSEAPGSIAESDLSATDNVSVERPEPATEVTSDVSIVPVSPTPSVFIQAGAFGQYQNAQLARYRLGSYGPVVVEEITHSSTPLFRVRLGPLKDDEQLEAILVDVIEAGYSDAKVIVPGN